MALSDDNRARVISCFDLAQLDDAEVREGYSDGFADEPCGDNRSRSYWHGWRTGMIDKGRLARDALDHALARDYAPRGETNHGVERVKEIREMLAQAGRR